MKSRSWLPLSAGILIGLLVGPAVGYGASSPAGVLDPDGIQRLVDDSGSSAKISLNRATGAVSFVRFEQPGQLDLGLPPDARPPQKARAFFDSYGRIFGLTDPAAELELVSEWKDSHGLNHVSYRQLHRRVPVFAAELRAHFDGEGRLTAVNGTFVPRLAVDPRPVWSAEEAVEIAIRTVGSRATGLRSVSEKLYVFRTGLARGIPGRDHLVWEVEVVNESRSVREFLYVDAHTGKVVDQVTGIHTALDRKVSESSLANVVWQDSAGNPDPIPNGWAGGSVAQVRAWQDEIDGSRETYNLFRHITNGSWLSYDGADATMRTVNNDPTISCPNANWNGVSTNYCNGTTADDVVAHEWGHAVTEYTDNLIYAWQPGALNESYSDIWGETVDLLNGRGTDSPGGLRSAGTCSNFGSGFPSGDNTYRWLQGEDATAFGGAIRDLWRPRCYGHPGKVSDTQYWCSSGDSGGVHMNSGVPNHGFALLVDGGTYNGQTISGLGLTKSVHIYWRAGGVYQVPTTGFAEHADALEASCTDLIGATLYLPKTDDTAPTTSGQTISAGDCAELAKAITAVEHRAEPTQCGFSTLLDPNAPALCSVGSVATISLTDWESGLGGWTAGTRAVAKPSTFDTPDWAAVGSLPDGRPGQAAFVADDPALGNCAADDESGVLYLESPDISIPAGVTSPKIAFDHWVSTEQGWDGGNVKIRVNGGGWTLVPGGAFTFNAYPASLNTAGQGNTNPLAGEAAFTGSDGGVITGSWGQSQISLSGIAGAGDSIRLRFEMGLDGCFGWVGWYVDDTRVYHCSTAPPGDCGNGVLDPGEVCDDGDTDPGDGCSDTCQVEAGWSCTDPVPGSGNVVADGSFEAGTPNPSWDEFSSNFGTPLCDAGCGGPPASDGTWYAWFGGIGAYEQGSLEQTLTIPVTSPTLEFDLLVGVCDSANDYLNVTVDGGQVFTTDPCTVNGAFTPTFADISSYADGQQHVLRFDSEIFATNGGNSNFFLDRVVIAAGALPSVCTAAGADLALSKLDSPDPVIAGRQLTYTLQVDNDGPADAVNVVVTDTLPPGVSLVSTSGCAEDPSGAPTCSLGTLSNGHSASYNLTVLVGSDVPPATTLTNTAAVSSDTQDDNAANDLASAQTSVITRADLTIAKVDLADPSPVAELLSYSIQVTNNGPSDAAGVVVTDTLPPGVTLVSTAGCAEDPVGVSTCSLGDLGAGQSTSFAVTVMVDPIVPADSIVINAATVASSTTDAISANNATTEQTTVSCPDGPLTLSGMTLSGSPTYKAPVTITAGPALTVQGSSVRFHAGQEIVFTSGAEIGGSFVADATSDPCP